MRIMCKQIRFSHSLARSLFNCRLLINIIRFTFDHLQSIARQIAFVRDCWHVQPSRVSLTIDVIRYAHTIRNNILFELIFSSTSKSMSSFLLFQLSRLIRSSSFHRSRPCYNYFRIFSMNLKNWRRMKRNVKLESNAKINRKTFARENAIKKQSRFAQGGSLCHSHCWKWTKSESDFSFFFIIMSGGVCWRVWERLSKRQQF